MKKSNIKTGDWVVLGNRPVYQGHKGYGETFEEASKNAATFEEKRKALGLDDEWI